MIEENTYCNCERCDFRNILESCFDSKTLDYIARHKKELLIKKGEVINREGDRITDFKYLKKGIVKLYRKTVAGEQIITVTKSFKFIASMSAFSETEYPYSMLALEDSTVCAINLDIIIQFMHGNGKFAAELLARISKINDKIIRQNLDIRQKNLSGRIAYAILCFSKDVYKSKSFMLHISRQEFADYIGMSSANVIRTLSELKHGGIIKTSGKIIEIIDMDRLEVISKLG
jgi:CRP/FNR family transcriptional regulator